MKRPTTSTPHRCARTSAFLLAIVTGSQAFGDSGPAEKFTIDQAIAAYGDDYRIENIAHNRTRYSWRYAGTTLVRSSPPPASAAVLAAPTGHAQTAIEYGTCALHLIADGGGRVESWQAEGNACASVLDLPHTWREHAPFYLTRPPAPRAAVRSENR